MAIVLDASALLAMVLNEPGGEAVEATIRESVISAVNWSEVIQKAYRHGTDIADLREEFLALGLTIVWFDVDAAEQTAQLWKAGDGLSLADRACLALGIKLGAPVWTADRYWTAVETGAEVRVIR